MHASVLVFGAEKVCVALDVLHNVNSDHRIRGCHVGNVPEVSVVNRDPPVAFGSLPQRSNVVSRRLDQKHLTGRTAPQYEVGYSPNARARFQDSVAECSGEGIDNPVVIVGRLGDRIELGAEIRKLGDDPVAVGGDPANLAR